jgi:porphobilinogen deaminase
MRRRGDGKGLADRLQDRAAGEHEVGTLAADAGVRGSLLEGHVDEAVHHMGDVPVAHPQAIDPRRS